MKIKEIIKELNGLDSELEVFVHTTIHRECNCPQENEYCYCDLHSDVILHMNNISKEVKYSKKEKKQIVTGIVFNCE